MTDEKIIESEPVFHGRIFTLRRDTIALPDGRTYDRELVMHTGAVALVPIAEDGSLILVRQYRAGARKMMLEIPAGGLEPDEPREDCARRELQEECGFYPEELIELGRFYVAASYTTELITIYLARDLRPSSLPGDIDEELTVERMPFQQALEMVLTNQIDDSKTLIGLVWAARYLGLPPFGQPGE